MEQWQLNSCRLCLTQIKIDIVLVRVESSLPNSEIGSNFWKNDHKNLFDGFYEIISKENLCDTVIEGI